MRSFFWVLFSWSMYGCRIEGKYTCNKRNETRWMFRLYPRAVPTTVMNILLLPIVFLLWGLKGVRENVTESYKVQSWSSYEIWSVSKPSKWDCYARS